ncbi:hypothetical protein FPCIR_9955 [Fusarium pseudocircinatum]|uniref:Uncharacterized protein n=1 Tax=Fusarium pseudocircinatum TaxID=56676 RepID=A0A8H5KW56_9HYPO|nr:hypothetical protein FPCIR_9955 [Fusarium pseudocircinatum]
MNYSNGLFTVCILAFSTAVCILGLILGVVFIFLQRQRDEQLLDDIYNTEKGISSIARDSSSNKNNHNVPNGGAYRRKLVTWRQDLWHEGCITQFNRRVWESDSPFILLVSFHKFKREAGRGSSGIIQHFSFIMIKLSNLTSLISKMSPRGYQMPLGAYNPENIPSNSSTMSNTEAELQRDESIPWGMIGFYILFSLFFLLTILRWTDLQFRIFCDFIDNGRWRAYFGMEVPGRHDQGNLKKVALRDDPLLVKKLVKRVRFYDDTTIIEDLERVEAKSNGVDCAGQDQPKRQ